MFVLGRLSSENNIRSDMQLAISSSKANRELTLFYFAIRNHE